MWLIASGAKRDLLNNKNYYKNLTENFPDYIPNLYEKQINLKRTFPKDTFFQEEEISIFKKKLFN